MKTSSKIFGFILVIPFIAFTAGDFLDQVAAYVKTGNSKEIAKYFDSNVAITIAGKEGNYSKNQAEIVLKDFFAKNSVKSFSLIHKGTSNEGSKYGIGSLCTAGGTYRTYIYVKQQGASYTIQELRFEKE